MPIVAIAIALLMVVSISTVAAPSSPVNAKIVNSGSKFLAINETTGLFIFVQNNKVIPFDWGARDNITGAFVVTSITQNIINPDGSESQLVLTPDGTPFGTWTNRWPQTVYNNSGTLQLTNPAVLPGENIVIFSVGWGHGEDEPLGKYTFTFVINGTIDSIPVTISAQTQITFK